MSRKQDKQLVDSFKKKTETKPVTQPKPITTPAPPKIGTGAFMPPTPPPVKNEPKPVMFGSASVTKPEVKTTPPPPLPSVGSFGVGFDAKNYGYTPGANTSLAAPGTPAAGGGGGGSRSYTPTKSTSNVAGNGGTTAPQQAVPETEMPAWLQTEGPSYTGGGGGGFDGVMSDYRNASIQDQAEMAAMMESMLSYIDSNGKQIMDQIRGQMGMDDPETANAIAMIKREAEVYHKEMLEDLNAKGLVQSGIYAEAKSRIMESQGMNVSNFVAQRFGDLQNQLNSAMMSLTNMRVGAMGQNLGMVNQNMLADRTQQAQMGMQNLSNQLTQRGQDLSQNQWSQTFDWQKSTDQRNFGYQQQRDTVGDQQFNQSLAASRSSGGGGGLTPNQAWEQQVYSDQLGRQDFGAAQQYVAAFGKPATMEEYNRTVANLNYDPMFANNPQLKEYVMSNLQKPATQPTNGGGTVGGWLGNLLSPNTSINNTRFRSR